MSPASVHSTVLLASTRARPRKRVWEGLLGGGHVGGLPAFVPCQQQRVARVTVSLGWGVHVGSCKLPMCRGDRRWVPGVEPEHWEAGAQCREWQEGAGVPCMGQAEAGHHPRASVGLGGTPVLLPEGTGEPDDRSGLSVVGGMGGLGGKALGTSLGGTWMICQHRVDRGLCNLGAQSSLGTSTCFLGCLEPLMTLVAFTGASSPESCCRGLRVQLWPAPFCPFLPLPRRCPVNCKPGPPLAHGRWAPAPHQDSQQAAKAPAGPRSAGRSRQLQALPPACCSVSAAAGTERLGLWPVALPCGALSWGKVTVWGWVLTS